MNGQSFEHALDTIRNRIAHQEDYRSTVTEPFFGGADVIIDDAEQPYHESFLEHQPAVIDATRYEPRRRVVVTRHAERLSALFYQFRDSGFDEIDYGTKYLVYGTLAQAALDYLTHNGDPDDPFPMLEHVFNAGETVLRKLRSEFSEGSEGMEAP